MMPKSPAKSPRRRRVANEEYVEEEASAAAAVDAGGAPASPDRLLSFLAGALLALIASIAVVKMRPAALYASERALHLNASSEEVWKGLHNVLVKKSNVFVKSF